MAAAARSGTCMFRGRQSGRVYAVDTYISDVANAAVNFDGGAGSGSTSPTYWRAPEDVVLYDFSVATGLTDTTKNF